MPRFEAEPNRHTPLFTTGTFLPPVIAADRTLTPANNPVIIAKTVRVPPNVTLTIQPGTRLVAHEYARLEVQGQLRVVGTAQAPVKFSSNERHPENQMWAGIVFEAGGRGLIRQARLKAASPAVSCLVGSAVTLDSVAIVGSIMDTFNCVY